MLNYINSCRFLSLLLTLFSAITQPRPRGRTPTRYRPLHRILLILLLLHCLLGLSINLIRFFSHFSALLSIFINFCWHFFLIVLRVTACLRHRLIWLLLLIAPIVLEGLEQLDVSLADFFLFCQGRCDGCESRVFVWIFLAFLILICKILLAMFVLFFFLVD